MKRIHVALLCVLLASTAFAGFDLGIKLGANYNYIDQETFEYQPYFDQFADLGSINSYVGGIFTGFGIGFFSLHLEAMMSMQGFDLQELVDGEDFFEVVKRTQFRTDYLNAALMARFHLDLQVIKPYIAAGINVGMPIDWANPENIQIDFSNFTPDRLGLAFSVGIKIFDLIDADLRYVHGITDILTGDISFTDHTFGQLVRLSVGLYIF
ncbi:MAG: PorT family protein [FCB group bacterium]|nr:PorT family protein [FCB group bacterium]